ncbi:hypothetical protein V5738_02665 [Salinisphaera sp. SPP-AMP-43]|uniref:hypothetical protein n=1 Tax=Salinisphaera sp. SPP-AMP-43 TaxID=3121288 RepID=UPI003C6E3960
MSPDRLNRIASWLLALGLGSATVLMASPVSAESGAQGIAIGGTTLRLGEPRNQVLGEARSEFNVSPADQDGQYFLYPKVAPLGPNGRARQPDAVGSITVANGRLVRVTRNLGSFRSADGQAAIQNLIKAFAQAPNQGKKPAVHTDTSMSGNASTQRVYFSYPDRVIQVLVFQPADTAVQATVDITEQYALSPNMRSDRRDSDR